MASGEERKRGLRIAPQSGDVVPARPRRPRPERELNELPSQEDVERFANVTRTCPECRKEVFDDAEVCYHCGYAFEGTTAGSGKSKTWIVVVAVLIVAAFVLATVGSLW